MLAGKKQKKKGEISNIVEDILHFAQDLSWCGFSWVCKEGNSVAHLLLLANLTLRDALHPPSCSPGMHSERQKRH